MYLVVETKANTHPDDLRPTEWAKIKCGKAHFKEIAFRDQPAKYEVAASVDELLTRIG